MPRYSPINAITKCKHVSNYHRSISSGSKEIGRTVAHQIKKINSVGLFRTLTKKKFELEPIEDRMQAYRKGFHLRSKDTPCDFDKIIQNGFGTYNNQCDYTLKLSLTPKQIRNSSY